MAKVTDNDAASIPIGVPDGPGSTPALPKKRGGGPRTPEGKRRSSRNAVKHGVFSRSPVVGGELDRDWLRHLEGMRKSFHPATEYEETPSSRSLSTD